MRSLKLTIDRGATYPRTFFYQVGGRQKDLTGWVGKFRLRDTSGALLFQVASDSASGTSTLAQDATLGKFTLNISPVDTLRLTAGNGFYELEITDGINVLALLEGPAQFRTRGTGELDATYVVINRNQQSQTVERSEVSELTIVDRGPPGPKGDAGANGADGSVAATDGKVTTATTTGTAIASFTVPRSKTFSNRVTITGDVSGDQAYTWVHIVSGVSDGAGNITLYPYTVIQDARTWATFSYSTTADTVTTTVYPAASTSTGWRQNVQKETTSS